MSKQTKIPLTLFIKKGESSEDHNHLPSFREKLPHVIHPEYGVCEFVPYQKRYKTQINEFARPFIDAYNESREKAFQEAMGRYERGERKTKPRRSDFPKRGYDYYERESTRPYSNPRSNKKELRRVWHSFILGLGDKNDRDEGRITQEDAVSIFGELIERFRQRFHTFLLLGASLHIDESGFYHLHLDFLPHFIGKQKYWNFCTGLEGALEHLGFKKEKSIANYQNKPAIHYNAMRNWLYRQMEELFHEHGFLLVRGVFEEKYPGISADEVSTCQSDWQDARDMQRYLQQAANRAIETLEEDKVDEEDITALFAVANAVKHVFLKAKPHTKLLGEKEYTLTAEDYATFWPTFNRLLEASATAYAKMQRLFSRVQQLESENADLRYDLTDRERDIAILREHLKQDGKSIELPELYRGENLNENR